jgi:hypothetical protein
MGRLSTYTQEIADAICERISEGHSLRTICAVDGMPSVPTVCRWVLDNDEFAEQYARARRMQAELLADQLFGIADDDTKDITGELEMPNGVAVQRSRLMVDTRKWYLSKVLPKIYGDKVVQEHQGKDGGPIQFITKSILEE